MSHLELILSNFLHNAKILLRSFCTDFHSQNMSDSRTGLTMLQLPINGAALSTRQRFKLCFSVKDVWMCTKFEYEMVM